MAAPPNVGSLKNLNTDILERIDVGFEDVRIYTVEELKEF